MKPAGLILLGCSLLSGISATPFALPLQQDRSIVYNETPDTTDGDAPRPSETLLPAVHWDHPVHDLQNLDPTDSHELYYSQKGVSDPSVQHMFASLSTKLHHNTVVLAHSALISNVSCQENGVLVHFSSEDAYSFAAKAWSAHPHFILITDTTDCAASAVSDDTRSYYLVDDIKATHGERSILAQVKQQLSVEEALDTVELKWGTYAPDHSELRRRSDEYDEEDAKLATLEERSSRSAKTCGVRGYGRKRNLIRKYECSTRSKCAASCVKSKKCGSYSFGKKSCRHYNSRCLSFLKRDKHR
jgi:hypothetical protein